MVQCDGFSMVAKYQEVAIASSTAHTPSALAFFPFLFTTPPFTLVYGPSIKAACSRSSSHLRIASDLRYPTCLTSFWSSSAVSHRSSNVVHKHSHTAIVFAMHRA